MTNKERLQANNAKIEEIQRILKGKILSSGDGEYFVKAIDYDGTILKEARLNMGDIFELPTPPSHNGLVFQEWSCSQDIVDNKITIEDNNVMVGAVYTTASGLNEFDIELTKVTGLDVTLNMDGTKDWGDGTSDDLTTHTYSDYGKYTIKCNGTTMTTSFSSGLFGQTSTNKNYYCVRVRFANTSHIGNYAFQYCYSLSNLTMSNAVTRIYSHAFQSCYSLKSITIPKSVVIFTGNLFMTCKSLKSAVMPNSITSIKSYLFYQCFLLTHVAIPNSVNSIADYSFTQCYSLAEIIIPSGILTVDVYAFQSCYSLKEIIIPSGATRFGQSAFSSCYSLSSIAIPKGITTVSTGLFNGCNSLTTYDFSTHTTIPTLVNIDAFNLINKIAKIIVPDNLYDKWIVATNWVTYADYIYKASEV